MVFKSSFLQDTYLEQLTISSVPRVTVFRHQSTFSWNFMIWKHWGQHTVVPRCGRQANPSRLAFLSGELCPFALILTNTLSWGDPWEKYFVFQLHKNCIKINSKIKSIKVKVPFHLSPHKNNHLKTFKTKKNEKSKIHFSGNFLTFKVFGLASIKNQRP